MPMGLGTARDFDDDYDQDAVSRFQTVTLTHRLVAPVQFPLRVRFSQFGSFTSIPPASILQFVSSNSVPPAVVLVQTR